MRPGEIVGLLGDNGAGKSTLIKVLSGAVPYTSGQILIRGEEVRLAPPTTPSMQGDRDDLPGQRARHAALHRAEPLSRARAHAGGLLDRLDEAEMNEVARDLLKRVGISKNIPPTTPIGSLSGGERQAVAIARAMYFESDLIILDEPTNNLGVAETQGVLRFVRDARDKGHACIFIAHNIHHVFQVVDRMVVMRQATVAADDLSPKTSSILDVENIITGDHLAA
jgi:simple sugar transport system ATP-binding protein